CRAAPCSSTAMPARRTPCGARRSTSASSSRNGATSPTPSSRSRARPLRSGCRSRSASQGERPTRRPLQVVDPLEALAVGSADETAERRHPVELAATEAIALALLVRGADLHVHRRAQLAAVLVQRGDLVLDVVG